MKLVVFGLTITSAWGNGHATTYRSLLRALAHRGHHITFIEKDVEWYRNNRDLPEPDFCTLLLYDDWATSERHLLAASQDADAILIGSYFPDAIPAAQALLAASHGPLLFYDIDTPITFAALRAAGRADYLDAAMIPHFDAYLSFTGGSVLHQLEAEYGARCALPFYCSVDPDAYQPTAVAAAYRSDLSYLGTYAEDRQPGLERFLMHPARLLPEASFLVAGAMYPDSTAWPANVARLTHVAPPDHAAFYSSARFTLNLTRDLMVRTGYSPSVRLFEASACGAVILSDDWPGIDQFLTPGEQILLPRDEHDVTDILLHLTDAERTRIGRAARERILAEHTSTHRALEFEAILAGLRITPSAASPASPDRDPAAPPPAAHASKSP